MNFLHGSWLSGSLIFQQRLFRLSVFLSLLQVKDETGTSKYLFLFVFQCKGAAVIKL